jgi:hypothetical protein
LRGQRDLVAGEAVGVAATVVALVVLADHLGASRSEGARPTMSVPTIGSLANTRTDGASITVDR